jgi:hypothetical protein
VKKLLFIALILTATVSRGVATADTLDFTGVGKTSVISIGGLYSGAVYAGELNWDWLGAPPAGFGRSLYTYCVDILNAVTDQESVSVRSVGQLTPATSPQTLKDRGTNAAWLFSTYAPGIHASGTGTQAAGLQVAIWEALYDWKPDLHAGNIVLLTPGDVNTWANSYLDGLANHGGSSSPDTVYLDTSHGQDQIAQVPEASSWMIVALGMIGAFVFGSRARRLV